MQQFLKPTGGSAWARIVATELLQEFLVPVDHAVSALDARLGRETLATLTGGLETGTVRRGGVACS
jgi:hypothetical protein